MLGLVKQPFHVGTSFKPLDITQTEPALFIFYWSEKKKKKPNYIYTGENAGFLQKKKFKNNWIKRKIGADFVTKGQHLDSPTVAIIFLN